MASVTSLGTGSGLDLEGIVTKLMTAESQPLTKFNTQESKLQTKISAFGSMKSALSEFQSSVQTLTSTSQFQKATTSVSDTDYASLSATGSATVGSYSLEVSQLAQAHKLKSGTAFTNTSDVVGTGTLSIQFGTYSSGAFTVNSDKAAATITIDSTNNTLAGVRDAINNAGASVKATIINDGTGNRLVLTSSDTGEVNSMRITTTDSDGNNTNTSGLSQLAYDASTGGTANMSQVQVAKNALFTLDGLSISKASNTVTDVISGATLKLLKKTATDAPISMSISRDTASVTTAVQSFVKAYNTLNTALTDLGHSTYDASTKTTDVGALQGDSTLRTIQAQLRSVMNGVLAGGGEYSRLSQVGISFDKNGTMSLDSSKLTSALTTNSDDVASLFTSYGVPTDSGITYTNGGSNTQAGNYVVNVTQLATKGVLNGSAITAPITIDANNDTLKLKINGVQSGLITLSTGSYTGANLAAELQTKINGDSALKTGGAAVSVTWNSTLNRLEVSSAKYGSSSTVEITSEDTNVASSMGLAVGTGTAGVDVAGTIGGFAATGEGQVLTSTEGTASGLKLTVGGTATGYRGTIAFNRGFAYQLDTLLTSVLSEKGAIATKITGLNADVTDVGKRRTSFSERLTMIEARYRKQFTALDTQIAAMKQTSTSLTSLLASLPSSSSSS